MPSWIAVEAQDELPCFPRGELQCIFTDKIPLFDDASAKHLKYRFLPLSHGQGDLTLHPQQSGRGVKRNQFGKKFTEALFIQP